jgi:hypothetical protein
VNALVALLRQHGIIDEPHSRGSRLVGQVDDDLAHLVLIDNTVFLQAAESRTRLKFAADGEWLFLTTHWATLDFVRIRGRRSTAESRPGWMCGSRRS